MKNYNQIVKTCEKVNKLSSKVIDEKLVYFAANNDKLDAAFAKRLARYKHIAKQLQTSWINMFVSQYIAYEVFKQGGLINKYLSHSNLPSFSEEEKDYLSWQKENPWKFSYSIVLDKPEKDFYDMLDVFTNETFLLYSKGVSDTLTKNNVALWFNMISYNGECWQSFGPIIPFQGIIPDDIFFFATELYPQAEIENEKDIYSLIDRNPVPFMLLFLHSNKPLIYSGNDQMVHNQAWYEEFSLDTKALKDDYIVEYNENVYRFRLRNWEYPHFSIAYFDENEKLLTLNAMTDKGFEALVNNLRKHGCNVSDEPDLRVTPGMLSSAGDMLKKNISLNEYDTLFSKDLPPEEQENLDNLNAFMNSILPDINAGRKPDIEKLAGEAGVDIETAKDLVKQLQKKFKK